jgi:hypothetical protein
MVPPPEQTTDKLPGEGVLDWPTSGLLATFTGMTVLP